jgi:hypothetical protein
MFYQFPHFDTSGYTVIMNTNSHRGLWSKIMVTIGSIGMLVGALDPLEGSVVILIGSGLVVLGTFLGQGGRRLILYRVLAFSLIVVGVSAMFALSSLGGFGGHSGLSMWWGVLVLPYLIGWSMTIWGPGNPRWFWCLGILVGLWYLFLTGVIISHPSKADDSMAPVITMAATGLTTIVGSVPRLVNAMRNPHPPKAPAVAS